VLLPARQAEWLADDRPSVIQAEVRLARAPNCALELECLLKSVDLRLQATLILDSLQ